MNSIQKSAFMLDFVFSLGIIAITFLIAKANMVNVTVNEQTNDSRLLNVNTLTQETTASLGIQFQMIPNEPLFH